MIFLRCISQKWSLESFLIRIGTRSVFSHVEFLNTDTWESLGSRLDHGVVFRKYDPNEASTEVWFTAPGIMQAYVAGMALIGHKYNWLDILGISFDQDWHTDGNYICSEFIARSFELAKCSLLNKDYRVWRLTPRDLLLSPYVTLAHVRKWAGMRCEHVNPETVRKYVWTY